MFIEVRDDKGQRILVNVAQISHVKELMNDGVTRIYMRGSERDVHHMIDTRTTYDKLRLFLTGEHDDNKGV